MKKTVLACSIFILFFAGSLSAIDKFPIHMVGVGLADTCGIYSSVNSIINAQYDMTKVASYVNLGLLAGGATMGVLTMLGVGDGETMLVIHRIIGYTVLAASIWLSVATTLDPGTMNINGTPWTSYAYSVFAAGPVILFAINF